ncbi:MAG: hypothetical protein M3Y27_26310, partial [Acidobacteriota bacterium]|nr:hypothetical protein [Acidobacteriota bacterium]
DRDTIIDLYDIVAESRFPHVNGFFSKDLRDVIESRSKWIFARAGDAFIACRPLTNYSWFPIAGGGRRLFSPSLKTGFVVQVAAASEYGSYAKFQGAMEALPLTYELEPKPSVRFQSLRGRQLQFTYGETPSVDGKPLDYDKWPLFGGPFLQADVDSERLTIRYGDMRRELNFRTLTVVNK